MSNGNWTKGEWRATPINTVVCGPKGRSVAIMQRCGRPQKEITANARLIAAAPDLLEACEMALDFIGTVAESEKMGIKPTSISKTLEAAIAKAQSKQSLEIKK